MPSQRKDERSPGLISTLKLNCWSQKILKAEKTKLFWARISVEGIKEDRGQKDNGQSFPYRKSYPKKEGCPQQGMIHLRMTNVIWEVFYHRAHMLSMLAGRISTDSLTTWDSNRSQTPRMLTRQYGWQHPRANLLIQLETRPGKINPTGCSLLSYTQVGLPTSSRPNPTLPLQLELWVLYQIQVTN